MTGSFKVLSALAPLAAFAFVACSGAGNQDLFEAAREHDDTSTTLPDPSTTTTPDSGTTTPALPARPHPVEDAGTPEPPTDPEPCTQEKEPNNDVNKATPFTTGLCGKIEASNDVDFGSFKVPQNAKSITWKHDENGGQLSYRFFVAGVSVPAVDDGALSVVPGATYAVQIRSASGNGDKRPTYELTVTIK